MQIKISNQHARHFLLKKQLLFPPQNVTGPTDIETVFQTLRIIQYDPLNPCGRNSDIVLQSRIQNYHPNDYYNWLYTEKKGIDIYDKELCIIPIEDLEFVTHRQQKAQLDKNRKAFVKKHQTEVTQIMEQIKINGPLTSTDIKFKKQVISGWGSSALVGRIALEQLWKMGQLVVVKREGMKKYYDLPSKLHSPIKSTKLAGDHLLRRLNSVGMLPKTTTGGGWQGLSGITGLINQLIKAEKVLEVKVEGSKLIYLINTLESSELTKPITTNLPTTMTFIAPLDNLIWDRLMIEDLFNFHYRWEVYTPKIKRKFGYYTLPILFGDEFIGRIEPLKVANKLEIKGLWQERKWNKKEIIAFNYALEKFAQYLNVSEMRNPFIPNQTFENHQ